EELRADPVADHKDEQGEGDGLEQRGDGDVQLADADTGQEYTRGCAQREGADLPLAQEEAQGQRGEQGDLRVLSQELRKSSHVLLRSSASRPFAPSVCRYIIPHAERQDDPSAGQPPTSAPTASRLPFGFGQGPHMTTPQATAAVPLLDRDLSWLEFNQRVLREALDDRTPLLERLKFLAIFSSNLDEWFMKRAEGLRQAQ